MLKRAWKIQAKKILNHQTKSVTSAALILAFASFLSMALGFLRDRLLAARFGAGNELDIYYTAFRIPDFLTMVLVIGAIGAAITPVFSDYLVRSREDSLRFISNLLNLFLVSLSFFSILLIIVAPLLIGLIAPGFSEEKKDMAVSLTRIMLLSPLLMGISNILASVLRVFRRFVITSFSPIAYNLGIILGIVFFVPRLGLQGLAWGVVFGSFLHLLIQVPVLAQVGLKFQRFFDFREQGFKKVLKLTLPRSIGLAAGQINLIAMTALASNLTSGKVAIFSFADGRSRPVLSLVGISFSTAAFPVLALAFSRGDKEKFLRTFSASFSKILLLIIPLSVFLFIFRQPLVEIILGSGKFAFAEVSLTAACLGLFSVGLLGQSLILLLAKAFYAMQNTKIPAITSIVSVIINISLALVFIRLLSSPGAFRNFFSFVLGLGDFSRIEIIGLPLAFSISATIQFLLLWLLFRLKFQKWKTSATSI